MDTVLLPRIGVCIIRYRVYRDGRLAWALVGTIWMAVRMRGQDFFVGVNKGAKEFYAVKNEWGKDFLPWKRRGITFTKKIRKKDMDFLVKRKGRGKDFFRRQTEGARSYIPKYLKCQVPFWERKDFDDILSALCQPAFLRNFFRSMERRIGSEWGQDKSIPDRVSFL